MLKWMFSGVGGAILATLIGVILTALIGVILTKGNSDDAPGSRVDDPKPPAAKGTVFDPAPVATPVEITGVLQGKGAKKYYKFEHAGGCARVWVINQSAGQMVVVLSTSSGGKLVSKITLSTSNNFGGSGISQRVSRGSYLASVQLANKWDAGSYTIQIASVPC